MPPKPNSYQESAEKLQSFGEKMAPGEAISLNQSCEATLDRAGMGLMALSEKAYGSVYDKERGKKAAYLLTARLLLSMKKSNPVLHLGDVLRIDSDGAVFLRGSREMARVDFKSEQDLETAKESQQKKVVDSAIIAEERLGQNIQVIQSALQTSDLLEGFGRVYKNIFVSTEVSPFRVDGNSYAFHKVQLLDFDSHPVSFFLHAQPGRKCIVLDLKGTLLSKSINSSELLDPNSSARSDCFAKLKRQNEPTNLIGFEAMKPIGKNPLERAISQHFEARVSLEPIGDLMFSSPVTRFSVFPRPGQTGTSRTYVLSQTTEGNFLLYPVESSLAKIDLKPPKKFSRLEDVFQAIESA